MEAVPEFELFFSYEEFQFSPAHTAAKQGSQEKYPMRSASTLSSRYGVRHVPGSSLQVWQVSGGFGVWVIVQVSALGVQTVITALQLNFQCCRCRFQCAHCAWLL